MVSLVYLIDGDVDSDDSYGKFISFFFFFLDETSAVSFVAAWLLVIVSVGSLLIITSIAELRF